MKQRMPDRDIIRKIQHDTKLTTGNRLLINLLLVAVFLFFMFPILWILLISFKTQSQIASMPPDVFSSFTFENYRSIFFGSNVSSSAAKTALMRARSASYFFSILNTLILSAGSVAIAALVGIPAAYGLSRFRNKVKEQLAFVFLSFRFVPELVIIVPLYLIYQKIGLYGTYFGLIWVYILIPMPLIIWIVRIHFNDLPYDLEQAAMLDGYSRSRAFFRIILPLAKPGIAAAIVLSFIYAWNNFLFAFVLSTTDKQPVTVAIMGYFDITNLNYGRMAASIIVAILPVIVVSQIASKYLVGGLSMGAVKK
jgi:multiple sugar transport system permease protein